MVVGPINEDVRIHDVYWLDNVELIVWTEQKLVMVTEGGRINV